MFARLGMCDVLMQLARRPCLHQDQCGGKEGEENAGEAIHERREITHPPLKCNQIACAI